MLRNTLNMDVAITNKPPTAEEFCQLRALVAWGNTDLAIATLAIENSLFHVTAYINSELVGMGRIVGDGAMFFYVQDLVILPSYQGKGLGKLLMAEIESYLVNNAPKGSTIGLFSAQGKEAFYTQFGYSKRTGDPLGLGMCKFV